VLLAALLWLLITKELRMFYLFATAGGFAYGGMAALISLISVELFGLGYIGLIIGVFTFSTTIGEATGPAVAGGIFDTTGSYQLAFLICTALSVITIILASLVKPIVSTKSGATVKLRSPTK
jgi:MFS family permease